MFQEKRLIIKQIKRHIGFGFECNTPTLLLRELEFRLIHVQTDRSDLGSGDLSVATAGRHLAPCL